MKGFRFIPQTKEEEEFLDIIETIEIPEREEERKASSYNDTLCKPLGSLGKMEDIYIRINGIFKGQVPQFKKAVVVYSSDNGVFEEGVSTNPQITTLKVCESILRGGSGLCKIASFYNTEVFLQDMGVLEDVEGHCDYKVRYSTENMRHGAAMERSEAFKALKNGFQYTLSLIDKGYNLLGFGEMGVANTTTSSALISVFTGEDPSLTTGLGSGLTRYLYRNKIEVIKDSISTNEPFTDTLDVLRKVGGLDIAAMAGSYLACAYRGIPFVLDGVISMASLMTAVSFNYRVRRYAFSSHSSLEAGAKKVEEYLNLSPPLNMGMRLGEGSGCPLGMNLIEVSLFTIGNMASFEDVAVNRKDYIDIRKGENYEEIF